MELEFFDQFGFSHRKEVRDGEGADGENAVQGIYEGLQDNQAKNMIVGEAAAPRVQLPLGAISVEGSASPSFAKGSETASQAPAGDEDEDEEAEECASGFDGLFDVVMEDAAAGPSAGSAGRRAGSEGAGGQAKPKAKAKGKAAATDANRQVAKLNELCAEVNRSQPAHIICLDKKHFKAVKSITDSLLAKVKMLKKRELQNSINICLKKTEVNNRVIKAYKWWVKKGDNQEFMKEHAGIVKFASEHPSFELELPLCVEQGIVEMKFIMGLVEDAVAGNHASMAERVGDALLAIISHQNVKPPKDIPTHVSWLRCFLLSSSDAAEFDLEESVKSPVQLIRAAFNLDSVHAAASKVNDAVLEIGRSSDGILKTISATGAGSKMLRFMTEAAGAASDKQQSRSRVASLLSSGTCSIDAIARLDAELAAYQFEDDENVAKFFSLFRNCIKKTCDVLDYFMGLLLQGDKEKEPPAGALESDVVGPLKALQDTRIMALRGDGTLDKPLLESLIVVSRARVAEVARGAIRDDDVAVLEDLASAVAHANKFSSTYAAFAQEHGLNVSSCVEFGKMGMQLLGRHEGRCVGPKMTEIMAVMMHDQQYWQELKDNPDKDDAVFLVGGSCSGEAVTQLSAMQLTVKGSMVSISGLVDETSTLLRALGKVRLATALNASWRLFALRLAFARHAQLVKDADLSKHAFLETDIVPSWFSLCNCVSKITAAQGSAEFEFSFDDVDAMITLGLPGIAKKQMLKEIAAAVQFASEQIQSTAASVAAALQRSAESLLSRIPKYEEYAVRVWNTEEVQSKLLDTSWDSFAESWVGLSKLANVAKSLDHAVGGGSFATRYSGAISAASRSLSAGRTFIAVVSTSKLILTTLPRTPKGERLALLESHKAKSHASNLPQNLADYINGEIGKLKKARS
ncbi:unnamed protein product [Prorocentrum cordatum]|uniref:Uncharacterized protein n=1 Tax=Prorocentrum cordatum TaxID=2364126 RepID=A0ABN9TBY2_9DINO|nr:unnamed protein product [Polarella glacialis]